MQLEPCSASSIRRDLVLVLIGNTAIGLFITVADGEYWLTNLIYSQAIGLSILGVLQLSVRWRGVARPGLLDGAVAIVLGGVLGFVLGSWGNGFSVTQLLAHHPRAAFISGAGALFFGTIAFNFFFSRARLQEAEARAREEGRRRVEQEALAAHTELRLLQAQIEPHFLFNTLSTVVSLVDTQPAIARSMLLDLTALLRTSLARTRKPVVSLEEEMELLKAYLGIMAARMGPRLQWSIELEAGVAETRLPPLLVQPLVENAIRHGLEPAPAGGHLAIRCRRQGEALEIAVEDSGLGLDANSAGGTGLGLANVRQRLAACYGEKARLELFSPPEGGTRAVLTLPLADGEGAA